MTKLRRLDIVVTNPQVVYFGGQVIQGQVVVELSEAMKMRGIRVKARGKGHIYWSEGSGDNRRTYSATENYLDTSLILCGKGSNESYEMSLPAGNHVFPFQFVLPPNLPGSFEGKSSCYVRYWLKANIDKPWKFDPECKYVFTMGSMLDLNTLPNVAAPAQTTDSKTVCCCCCESDPITASFRIDRTGYVPGEAIVFNAEISENTGRGAHGSKVKLVMKTTYRTHGGSKKRETTECAKLEHGPISAGGSDVWSNERLAVPALPPSYLAGCNIIEIDYYITTAGHARCALTGTSFLISNKLSSSPEHNVLKLKVDVVDTPFDLELPLDVVIGSIPLQSVVQQYMPQMGPGVVTEQPTGFNTNFNFNMPPPTYQECVFGKVDTTDDDDKHATGNMSYAPSYTYYDWLNPPVAGATNMMPTAPPTAPPPPAYGFS